jgi:hypothetical protein
LENRQKSGLDLFFFAKKIKKADVSENNAAGGLRSHDLQISHAER